MDAEMSMKPQRINIIIIIRRIMSLLLIWVNIFSFIMFSFSNKSLIMEDLKRLERYVPFKSDSIFALNYALLFIKPFRSVFKFRTVQQKPVLAVLSLLSPRPITGIEIDGKIQGGVLIYHKMGCVISPYRAGTNLTVSQGVTIGKGKPNKDGICAPIIGDNVQVLSNAIVFGGISIGNNVIVGAGTVLNKNVPSDCTVVGNPARIIKQNGNRCDIKL